MGRALHRQLAWLALCAMMLAALVPSISKLLATSQGVVWTEICSTSGTKLVALDLGAKTVPDAPMGDHEHCGYCVLQRHSPFIPTLSHTLEAAVVSSDRLPVGSGGSTVFKRFVRDAHRTRAPPAFS